MDLNCSSHSQFITQETNKEKMNSVGVYKITLAFRSKGTTVGRDLGPRMQTLHKKLKVIY